MHEACAIIITRESVRGKETLEKILQILIKKRNVFYLDKYNDCEPIKLDYSVKAISGIVSSAQREGVYEFFFKAKSKGIAASIWFNTPHDSRAAICIDMNRPKADVYSDFIQILQEIASVCKFDFGFVDSLTARIVENGKKIGAAARIHKDKDNYGYFLGPRALKNGFPDAYNYMVIHKNCLENIEAVNARLSNLCTVSEYNDYFEYRVSGLFGDESGAVDEKMRAIHQIIARSFHVRYWQPPEQGDWKALLLTQ
jgi:hypothetical protein